MTRENPLTHHEKLRYDYLLKNIHYLNDKEKREFAFLQAKLDKPQQEVRQVYREDLEEFEDLQELPQEESNIGLPTYGKRSRSSRSCRSNNSLTRRDGTLGWQSLWCLHLVRH